MRYIPTIGIEVHVELKTKPKMFCGCFNNPHETRPNTAVCPVCTGHPGTLPTINKEAVNAVIQFGYAIKGIINENSHFDRKSYFYPDLPKGYQISQYEYPLVSLGVVRGVHITRVHLEEDTGKIMHEKEAAFIDFNRAGRPLMELVTEPELHSAEDARKFGEELQLILRYLGISEADMEKGQMRVEANISIAEEGSKKLGTKVEVKNLNSFKAVFDSINYEVRRQEEVLSRREQVTQETRGWNEKKGETMVQRTKESAHDYRYFPEPDLPPLRLNKEELEALKQSVPELPEEKRKRLTREYMLSSEKTEVLISNRFLADYFEKVVSEYAAMDKANIELVFNYLTSDLRGIMLKEDFEFNDLKFEPEDFAHLMVFVAEGRVSSRGAKDILKKMFETGLDPEAILVNEGLLQVSNEDELISVVERVIAANPSAVLDYKKGKGNVLQFLVGRAMAELKGKGNPQALLEIIKKRL